MRWLAAAVSTAFVGILLITPGEARAGLVVFSTDFNSGLPSQFSGGSNSLESVQQYNGLGPAGNTFSGNFLRNTSGGPALSTVLTLTNLPAHTGVGIDFLLAIIDSWDGDDTSSPFDPDLFNVKVDGNLIFSASFINSSLTRPQEYVPPPGVEIARLVQLGFNPGDLYHLDSAYNMGLDPIFGNIPHTSSTLTIEWFAGGSGWQGGDDESWAIDNVQVRLLGVPEPSSLLLGLISSISLISATRARVLVKGSAPRSGFSA